MVRKEDKLSLKKCRNAPKDLPENGENPALSALSALSSFSEHPPVCPVYVVHATQTVEVESEKYSFKP